MNPYIEAIHRRTKYNREFIAKTIRQADKVLYPHHQPGTMQDTIFKYYRVIREYEQIIDEMQRN